MPLIASVPFFINAPQFDMCAAPWRAARPAAHASPSGSTSCTTPITMCAPAAELGGCAAAHASPPSLQAPASPAQYKYVDSFQSGVLALIAALPPGTGVFAPTCLVHVRPSPAPPPASRRPTDAVPLRPDFVPGADADHERARSACEPGRHARRLVLWWPG